MTLDEVTMRDSIVVIAPAELPREEDPSACLTGIPLKFAAPLKENYAWSNRSSEEIIIISDGGRYAVTVTNECGAFAFTWNVTPKTCACEVFVPIAFTKGVSQPLGAYFCTVSYTIKNAGVPQTVHQKGDCILLR